MVVSGRRKEVHPIMYVMGVLFVLYFIYVRNKGFKGQTWGVPFLRLQKILRISERFSSEVFHNRS